MKIKNIIKKLIGYKNYLEKYQEKGMKFGKNLNMYSAYIDWNYCNLVEIGDDVTLSHCSILAHDASTKMYTGKSKIGNVMIGSRVFVGYNSIVLPNVKIGNDVIIGAGTVVSKNIPDNSVVVGNPARIIGKTSDYIEKHKNFIQYKPVLGSDMKREDMRSVLKTTFVYSD